ncbi:MAG: GTP pyrophosphokinase [Candidatus Marinimicrobia bacterium]|nr:GTP pyrophosphokinase [Candidatus Neomarinimicrobiota bacterium]|tara:strand:+ start:3170 stop:3607 length:438 start_codon:yes stop_codon:yes gene_type:complete
MKKLNKAIKIAAEIHTGNKGKKNEPAILHPIRVMLQMNDQLSRTVAILHDVVESGKMTVDDLRNLGFNNKTCRAVDLLSRRKWESYDHYIKRVKTNKLAIKVKIADLEDNYNIKQNKKKLSKLDKSKINKYNRAYKKLTGKKLTS